MTENTKNTMKEEAKLAKAKILLKRLGITSDATIKQLTSKYGANTYDIVLNAMLRPTDMMKAAGENFCPSRKVVEYYANNQVSVDSLSVALGKDKNLIAKNNTVKVNGSSSKEEQKKGAKVEKFNNRVSNRSSNNKTGKTGKKANNNASSNTPKYQPMQWETPKTHNWQQTTSSSKTPQNTQTKTTTSTPKKSQNTPTSSNTPKYQPMQWETPKTHNWQQTVSSSKTPQKTPTKAKTTTSAQQKKTAQQPTPTPNKTSSQSPYLNWNELEAKTEHNWTKDNGILNQEPSAETECENLFVGRMSGQISIQDLMKETGVTQADIQALFKKDPSIVQKMGTGSTNKKLAKKASNVTGTCAGNCLSGVQNIHAGVTRDPNAPRVDKDVLSGQNPDWPEKVRGTHYNSACNAYKVLEKSGQFITLSYPNKAYNKSEDSPENRAMKEFNAKLPPGTTACIDNDIPDGYKGRTSALGQSAVHGHVWVINNEGESCSDGVQTEGPDFSRYGKKMYISVAKDNTLSKDLVLKLLQQRDRRLEAEQKALAQNKQNGRV